MSEADPQSAALQASAEADAAAARRQRRRRLLTGIAGVVAVAAIGYGAYDVLVLSHYASTDDAYVNADVAQVTPQVGGPVQAVYVQDTQAVHKGDLLIRIDPADEQIAVEQAQADLMAAMRKFNQTQATSEALTGQVQARTADIQRAQAQLGVAQADFDRARVENERRQKLATTGAVSGDELTASANAFATAKANLLAAQAAITQAQSNRSAARGDLAANEALIAGTTIDRNPDVAAARARLAQAKLDLSRTEIRAAVDGVVSQRQVQVGQRVSPGTKLMVVVPINSLYVDANFKEGQLKHVQPGQPVKLTSDLYGGNVVFHGRVTGFSGGTGAAFALIPAQNATGNWIKVVQRLPVRVALDPQELRQHPLRVGLSMNAEIDLKAGA